MDYDKVFEVLGEKYPNISFIEGGFGSVPVQAFGQIDDEYFYFRFRFNHATLTVGPYDEELASLYVQRVREDAEAREHELDEADPFSMFFTVEYQVKKAIRESNPQVRDGYLPIRKTRYASLAGENPEDEYKGELDTDEFISMFSTLVNNLKSIPESEQLSDHVRIWLYEGRAAVNAWQEKAKKEN